MKIKFGFIYFLLISLLSLVACKEAPSFFVKFDYSYGYSEAIVEPNALLSRPADPIKPNYDFIGWSTDKSETALWDFTFDTVTSDLILHAVWKFSSEDTVYCSLVFDTSGGQPIQSQSVVYDTCGDQPENPVKDGSIFWYWSTASKGGIKFDFSLPIVSDTTVYAQYYTEVSFYDGEALLATWQIPENSVVSEPVPLTDHYGFDGWFTKEGKLFDFALPILSSVELYGKWSLDIYTVRFMLDSEWKGTSSVKYGDLVSAPEVPTKVGSTFVGWFTEPTFLTYWAFDLFQVVDNIVLYGKWITDIYNFYYISEGKVIAQTPVPYGDKVPAPTNNPSRIGYDFAGWYREPAFLVSWNFERDVVLSEMSIYAKWVQRTVSVHFDSNGGSPVSAWVGYSNSLVSMPLTPVRDGYTFIGWYTSLYFTQLCDFDSFTAYANAIIYARWERTLYTVKFEAFEGGTIIDDQYLYYGEGIDIPATPYRQGYYFQGWFTSPDFDVLWDFSTDKVKSDLVLYAYWVLS
jgi:uncharacterized repeat protein (TIGR02543 family)